MKRTVLMIGIFVAVIPLLAQSSKEDFSLQKNAIQMGAGGSAPILLNVTIPIGKHIYVRTPKDSGIVITQFSLENSRGFAIKPETAPQGVAYEEHSILKGLGRKTYAGTYTIDLYETAGRNVGAKQTVTLVVKTQMCDTAKNVCYKPEMLRYTINVTINRAKQKLGSMRATGGVQWVNKYDSALKTASQKKQNVFVVLTAPSWCGYCVVLEREVFGKEGVQSVLNSKIVPLQVLDSNSDTSKFRFDGYPTMYVYNASGKQMGEISSRTESGFLSQLKPYLSGTTPTTTVVNVDEPEEIPSVTFSPGASSPFAPKKRSVLVGFNVRHGEIVDAVQPIYSVVDTFGRLGPAYNGPAEGGKGGQETRYVKPGHVVVGFSLRRGTWFDQKGIDSLVIKWKPWANGHSTGETVISDPIADMGKLLDIPNDSPESFDYEVPDNQYIVGVKAVAERRYFGDVYLSDLQPVYSSTLTSKDGPSTSQTETDETKISTKADTFYKFEINIVSGSKAGQSASGTFTYDSSLVTGKGVEMIEVKDFSFQYGEDKFTNMDWKPKVRIEDGEFKDLFFVGGPQKNRFGANVGFSRNQFGRANEGFVRDGDSYFAYLNPATYVDGVGTITYTKE